MDGILFVNKPKNLTSRDVVNQVSKIYNTKKIGHTGTLDPMATGVLILCLGKYTKLVNLLTSTSKEYIATMKLGIKTDTKDITGKVIQKREQNVTEKKIIKTFHDFPRKYIQEVPIYSAVKVNGKKLYEYAREKKDVVLPKREVEIYDLEILKIEKEEITFRVAVSKGTYIRSLIEDLGKQMDSFATMKDLKRIKQGNISIEECVHLEEISANTPLKKMEDVFSYPIYKINESEKWKVSNGNPLQLNSHEKRLFLIFEEKIVALYEKENDFYKMIFKVI